MKPIKSVTWILYRDDGRVLMEWREDGIFSPGFWSFPGGKLEPGETPDEALYREMYEEHRATPVRIHPLTPFEYSSWPLQPYFISRHDVQGNVAIPETESYDGHPLIWVPFKTTLRTPWKPARRMAEEANRVVFHHG